MIIYKDETIKRQFLDKFICDRCKNRISDEMELQETYSIKFRGGYNSVFGDENDVSCDLCQDCLKKLIGDFCRYNDEE